MIYLNEDHIRQIGIDWGRSIERIRLAVQILAKGDFSQPIKPYLRFQNPKNRIIAMPAYVGGEIEVAGIKWIASFPENINQGIPRAQSVTILNEAQTGTPFAIINTAVISGIRTASVSGLMIEEYCRVRPLEQAEVGIIGFGPIGQLHLQMVAETLGDRLKKIKLYDVRGIDRRQISEFLQERVEIVDTWEAAYDNSDVFITCTVSSQGYIHREPKPGALLLNVSLRDFKPEILDYTQSIIVDSWEEVCRENTDIEHMHLQRGLQKEATRSIADVVCSDEMQSFPKEQAILFNPMGMAIFDIATAADYCEQALEKNIGLRLDQEAPVSMSYR